MHYFNLYTTAYHFFETYDFFNSTTFPKRAIYFTTAHFNTKARDYESTNCSCYYVLVYNFLKIVFWKEHRDKYYCYFYLNNHKMYGSRITFTRNFDQNYDSWTLFMKSLEKNKVFAKNIYWKIFVMRCEF